MAKKTQSFERFWQELKRRKTGKVIIAYAATAFIILQLADLLTPALLLPDWTTRLVTLVLIIGFPIAIIFSWIFDITPEGIKKTEATEEYENSKSAIKPKKRIFSISNIIITALITVVGILAYPRIFKRSTIENLRSSGERLSVAVMPFQNITNDTIWNIWQTGIQTNLITSLSNSEELKVRQIEPITGLLQSKGLTNYALITPSVASKISQKLDANVFIQGSINQGGLTIRLNAQLIDSKTKDALKSFQIDGEAEKILDIIDSLSVMMKNYLIISILNKKVQPDFQKYASTNFPEAYKYFISGTNAFLKSDFTTARNMDLQALAIDSNFTFPIVQIAFSYGNQSIYDQAKKWCLKAYEKKDQMPMSQKNLINLTYARYFETPYEEIKILQEWLTFDDQSPFTYWNIGNAYDRLNQSDKAIAGYEKSLAIYNKWDSKPLWIYNYTLLGQAYHKTGQYKKEKKLYKEAEQDFQDNLYLIYRQAILSLTEGDTVEANEYIKKYIALRKENSASEPAIATNLADIYSYANLLDRAEKYFRQALTAEPYNPIRLNNLAWFLIDKDRNQKEGLELVDKALEMSTDNYFMLDTKGWGLYKQGNYEDALELLQKSWDLRRQNAVYKHEAFLHLEAAKKAVASQKNN